jgi:mannose-6-phosphate isomerase-like protein (cupin superfamily)
VRDDVVELDLTSGVGRKRYDEVLRRPSMTVGVYRLAAGATDPQSPHDEDELYYVLSGEAVLAAGTERIPVRTGSGVFVAKGVSHKFVDIGEALEVLVLFAPAEPG